MKKSLPLKYVVVAIFIVIWFCASNCFFVNDLFLPSPQRVWKAFVEICLNGYKGVPLIVHITESLRRLLIAYLLAAITAIPLGLLSGYNSVFRDVIEPIINFYRPLPPLAYYTLLILWLGIGDGSKIFLLFLASFAPLYISCSQAVSRIEPNYIYSAKALGAKRRQVFRTVVFPYVLPDIFSGLRTAMGVGYTTLVAAEMVASRGGIGWMVLDASNYLRSDIIFVGILIMGITGIILDNIIIIIGRLAAPWKGKNV